MYWLTEEIYNDQNDPVSNMYTNNANETQIRQKRNKKKSAQKKCRSDLCKWWVINDSVKLEFECYGPISWFKRIRDQKLAIISKTTFFWFPDNNLCKSVLISIKLYYKYLHNGGRVWFYFVGYSSNRSGVKCKQECKHNTRMPNSHYHYLFSVDSEIGAKTLIWH